MEEKIMLTVSLEICDKMAILSASPMSENKHTASNSTPMLESVIGAAFSGVAGIRAFASADAASMAASHMEFLLRLATETIHGSADVSTL